jgi:hypothetical protein
MKFIFYISNNSKMQYYLVAIMSQLYIVILFHYICDGLLQMQWCITHKA